MECEDSQCLKPADFCPPPGFHQGLFGFITKEPETKPFEEAPTEEAFLSPKPLCLKPADAYFVYPPGPVPLISEPKPEEPKPKEPKPDEPKPEEPKPEDPLPFDVFFKGKTESDLFDAFETRGRVLAARQLIAYNWTPWKPLQDDVEIRAQLLPTRNRKHNPTIQLKNRRQIQRMTMTYVQFKDFCDIAGYWSKQGFPQTLRETVDDDSLPYSHWEKPIYIQANHGPQCYLALEDGRVLNTDKEKENLCVSRWYFGIRHHMSFTREFCAGLYLEEEEGTAGNNALKFYMDYICDCKK